MCLQSMLVHADVTYFQDKAKNTRQTCMSTLADWDGYFDCVVDDSLAHSPAESISVKDLQRHFREVARVLRPATASPASHRNDAGVYIQFSLKQVTEPFTDSFHLVHKAR